MPADGEMLRAMAQAARLSSAQLDRICQAYFGQGLTLISAATTPAGQAEDMVRYAEQYGLLEKLASALLQSGADSPAMQNLLLDRDMVNEQGNSLYLHLVRLENKVDRLGERFDAMERRMERSVALSWSNILTALLVALALASMLWLAGRL